MSPKKSRAGEKSEAKAGKRKPKAKAGRSSGKSRAGRWRGLRIALLGLILFVALAATAMTLLLVFPVSGPDEPESFGPPEGFAGAAWDREVNGLGDLEVLPSPGPFELRRPMGALEFEGERLNDVQIVLYKDRLAGATVWLDDERAFDRVVARLSERYGPPKPVNPGQALTWDWPDVGIAAVYLPGEDEGVLTLTYKPLARQAAEAQQ